MPCCARLALAGIAWHMIQRGNNRAVCFHAVNGFQCYLHYLKAFAEESGCAVHACAPMTNHVDLPLTPQHEDRAALMM